MSNKVTDFIEDRIIGYINHCEKEYYNNFTTTKGLLYLSVRSCILLFLSFILYAISLYKDLTPEGLNFIAISLLLITTYLLFIFIYWQTRKRIGILPRTKKDRIGIYINIISDNKEINSLVENTVIESIKKEFSGNKRLQVAFTPNHLSESFNDTLNEHVSRERSSGNDSLQPFFDLSRGCVFISAKAYKAKSGEEKIVIDYNSLVTHPQLLTAGKKRLQKEIKKYAQHKLIIPNLEQINGMEVTADVFIVVIKMLAGIASRFKLNFKTAKELHNEVLQYTKDNSSVKIIHTDTIKNLAHDYIFEGELLLNKGYIDKAEELIKESLKITPLAEAYMFLAVITILKDNNLKKARKYTNNYKGYPESIPEIVIYNNAFINMYLGKVNKAISQLKSLKVAEPGTIEYDIAINVITFNYNILNTAKGKEESFLIIALIVYYALDNGSLAYTRLNDYLKQSDESQQGYQEALKLFKQLEKEFGVL